LDAEGARSIHGDKTSADIGPVLALPDFNQEFILGTDASATGVGVVLMQNWHPIAFLGRALGVMDQILLIYDKECLAILSAIAKWRTYLQHHQFSVHTNQHNLIHLGVANSTQKYRIRLFRFMGLQYIVWYKKGNANKVANALCWMHTSSTIQSNLFILFCMQESKMNSFTTTIMFEACGPVFDNFIFSPADETCCGLVCPWKDEVLYVANFLIIKHWISINCTIVVSFRLIAQLLFPLH
jgi:hypothetical protein